MGKNFKKLTSVQYRVILKIMDWTPPKERGTPRKDLMKIWNSIFYVLFHRVSWKDIPNDPAFAPKSTAHRWFHTWKNLGILDHVLSVLLQKSLKKAEISPEQILPSEE